MRKLIVVDQPADWDLELPNAEIIAAKTYLTDPKYGKQKGLRVFNLSNAYDYQSNGYYVSLIAEARGHQPSPDVRNIVDFKARTITKILSEELEALIQKSLKSLKSEQFKLSVYFGKNTEGQYNDLAKELHKLFRAPLLRASFSKTSKGWTLNQIRTIAFKDIPKNHVDLAKQFAAEFFSKRRFDRSKENRFMYDLAILVDDKDPASASNKQALNRFIEVGEKLGVYVELIGQSDFNRLSAFDALFVRMNTHVKNYSYQFVRKAESEGMAVLDHTENILKCGSKVYMTEVLQNSNLPIPKSKILYKDNWKEGAAQFEFPFVLKLPDSSFSVGVKKVKNKEELHELAQKMFAESDLVIAQEFLYTDYDWRIGVLDGEAIYGCKYHMATGHWQIYNWDAKQKKSQSGNVDTYLIEDVPEYIVSAAKKAAALINHRGLFGVDMKELAGKAYVIEVNDNPNIDYGCEDLQLKDKLYAMIINAFKKRIEEKIRPVNE